MTITISKNDTKTIKCRNEECPDNGTIVVPKWASNLQYCAACQANIDVNEEPSKRDPSKREEPIDKVKRAQAILGELGFVITNRGYHKIYYDGQAAVRVEPVFDKGTSLDVGYALVGFSVSRQEIVAVTDANASAKIPSVAHQDIHSIMKNMQIKVPGVSLTQQHVDNVVCSRCGTETPEWIQMANQQILCMKKCAPTRRPYNPG